MSTTQTSVLFGVADTVSCTNRNHTHTHKYVHKYIHRNRRWR